ncbi:Anti-sigma-K factor RskA [Fibrisoma limi BUZ 3]|uniref:Regulator of SigK n=2 Tax=Fibrisoma limi TaxID=663275 RepID=I2GNS9_9BACT|nr:Anti-sigma-K factor RskA [Fibrisoma limi BUZ 3]
MNVTEYIASGILESYVMGAVSDQERREVDCLSSIYPEIKQELEQLSASLENYALLHSIEPPPQLKASLLQKLTFEEQEDRPEPIVRPMPVEPTSRPTFQVTWIAAAAVGLLLLTFSFFLVSRLNNEQQTVSSLQSTNSSLQTELRQLRDRQQRDEQVLALLRQPGTRTLELRGNEKAPNGDILLYWNPQNQQVAVEVRSLPSLQPDQQYQLWSLVNGKPIDAGVFDGGNAAPYLQRLNRPIGQADAFAITVEKRGGSPTPTLSTLLAMTPVGS